MVVVTVGVTAATAAKLVGPREAMETMEATAVGCTVVTMVVTVAKMVTTVVKMVEKAAAGATAWVAMVAAVPLPSSPNCCHLTLNSR